MKLDKAAKLVKRIELSPKWSKKAKKWKKRAGRIKWIPRIYRKRKHLGNLVYSVMYLVSKRDE